MIEIRTASEAGTLIAEKVRKANIIFEEHAIIYIGALGICVRKIKDLINDKYTDPAVICIDSTGKYVIPVLSGHVGGANDLAKQIATIIGGEAIITTQSDNMGLWTLDTIAKRFSWNMVSVDRKQMNHAIALFVNRRPTALLIDFHDEGSEYLTNTKPEHVSIINSYDEFSPDSFELLIIVSPRIYPSAPNILQYIPACMRVGIGLSRNAQPTEDVIANIFSCVNRMDVRKEAIESFNTIDIKSEEPVVKALQERGYKFNFYTASELSAVEVPNPSNTVSKHVGTPSVSEAAAMIEGEEIIVQKQKGSNWTMAMARIGAKTGHIEIIGAGPGDPELISVRGKRILENADLILYAGSLVPKELTYYAKQGCVVRSSADMALEEQFMLMKNFYDRGKLIARLHTGDPCIYGAIQEQMAFFDKYNMHYHITPGISSFLAAAAELRSQFTIPEKCQTIILTRGEGRTPMPDREKLHLLAAHQSTMCIFLSASIVDEVQQQLLDGGYHPDTPIAACYRLTWKDQRIYRGKLKDLASILHTNNLTLTTMIVVGDAIDNRHGLSKLYDTHFTHMFRKATH